MSLVCHLSVWLMVGLVTRMAVGGEPAVVPGQQIGRAVLGMTQRQMSGALGKPDATMRLDDGIIRADWLSKVPAPKSYAEDGLYFSHDFLTAYFREGRAFQIEVSSAAFKTREDLSTASSASKFRRLYPDFVTSRPPHFHNPDPQGLPAPRHFVVYEDALSQGVAWRYGAWGGMFPEPDPDRLDMVLVHRRGEPAFVDPDGGIRLVNKRKRA